LVIKDTSGGKVYHLISVSTKLGEDQGSEVTTIDGEGVTRGIYLNSGETLASVVSGFTFINCLGDDQPGAAIYCSHASLTLHNVVLANNTAVYGAGIMIGYDSIVLDSVQFVDNIANLRGGGLNAYQAEVVIESASFTGNRSGKGGAIYCRESNLTISNSVIEGNQAGLRGGGIAAEYDTTVEIEDVHFINNVAAMDEGGGLYLRSYSTGFIQDCLFWGNQALEGHGGGVYCIYYVDPVFVNVTFAYNYAKYSGGGITMYFNCSPTLNNCTLYGNSIYPGISGGGGIWMGRSTLNMSNSILAFSFGSGIQGSTQTVLNLDCCDIFGNDDGDYAGDALDQTGINGNISVDPQFCGIPGSDNYYLQSDSPCAPVNNDCGVLMGVYDIGCETTLTSRSSWSQLKSMY
jgi:predicted outer membrane repeat protein